MRWSQNWPLGHSLHSQHFHRQQKGNHGQSLVAAFFTQMQYSDAETKQPILIDSEFTQPEKLQLRFCPMGKYAASTFTSHIRIPLDYSILMDLQYKLDARLGQFLDVTEFNFEMDESPTATLKSTFQIYKQSTREIFKLFHVLLASLLHVHERHCCQWDVASFVAAMAALSLATYNAVQISKLETAIEAQEAKADLLADIAKLHEQHLNHFHGLINGIGKELQVIKLQQTFQIRVDRIVAQILSDDSKLRAVIATFERIIITAFNKKLLLELLVQMLFTTSMTLRAETITTNLCTNQPISII
jgi:hypothetical protein